MKKKITIITISLIAFLILGICFSTISNAAVESKAGTNRHMVEAGIAYQYCYDMRSSTSTLGNNSLDPHLTLNADWGAMTYLGYSTYGDCRNKTGVETNVNGTTYYSTTNNITGLMFNRTDQDLADWMSAYIEGQEGNVDVSSSTSIIIANNKNTKYVEQIPYNHTVENTLGMAITETGKWYDPSSASTVNLNKYYPILCRNMQSPCYVKTLARYDTAAYRPVIWN